MVMKRWIMGALLMLGLVMGSLGAAQAAEGTDEPVTCGMCGKEMTNAHVGFILTHPDGKEERFGCAGCGLSVLKEMKEAKEAKPRTIDFLRGDEIDARAAYYVRGSTFTACCEPSFLAFAKKDEAERFVKGFGGKVLDFESAFQAVHAAHHHGK